MRITVPRDGRITLLSRITGTRQVHHSLAVGRGTLVFVQPLGMIQREKAAPLSPQHTVQQSQIPFPPFFMAVPTVSFGHRSPIRIQRFRAVAPPSIETVAEEFPVGIFPIARPGQGIESVIHRTGQHKATPLKVFRLGAVRRVGPNGHHQLGIPRMYGICQRTWVGIVFTVHLHVPPLSARPIIPILHDDIQRHLPPTVFLHDVHKLLRMSIAFLRLNVTENIPGHHRRLSRQLAVLGHDAIHRRSFHEIIIHLFGGFQFHETAFRPVLELHPATRIEQQAVAGRGVQHRYHLFQVMLAQVHRLAPQVEEIFHVASQTIKRLAFRPAEMIPELPSPPHRVAAKHVHHFLLSVGRFLDSPAIRVVNDVFHIRLLRLARHVLTLGKQNLSRAGILISKGTSVQIHPHFQAVRLQRKPP